MTTTSYSNEMRRDFYRRFQGATRGVLVTFALAALSSAGQAQLPSIADYARGIERHEGFFPVYYQLSSGRLLLEIARPGEDFLYLKSLVTGLGIAVVDIDRGSLNAEAIARFERRGPRMHLVIQNTRFTNSDVANTALSRSVRESFAPSTIVSLEIMAEDPGGAVLADATPLVLSDVVDVRGMLRENGEGVWQLDRDRSAVWMERTRAFPRNTELEGALTFTNDNPSGRIQQHTIDGRSITLREHHSFVALPEPGYVPRPFDPRMGFNPTEFYDFSQRFDSRYLTRYASRHRLVKKDPSAAMSEPLQPIVYYLDRAVPEPYRTAFKTGAAWWSKAYEAAGFINAFRVEDMPEDMDPLDARYNVIVWFHRTQPSSSYGMSFVDPRTGEIIKAVARMDSHRSLVDYNIAAGASVGSSSGGAPGGSEVDALAALDEGTGDWIATLDSASAERFTMSRRRQHIAHELGHTLGLAHNFIGHANGRASAMDYPAPLIKLTNGRIDLSDAYRDGIGAYDSLAIRWGYSQFLPGAEAAGLKSIVDEMMAKGIQFMTNSDEQSSGSYPEATTWVNGADAVEELARVMAVRRVLIDKFDESAIAPGDPMWLLNYRFNPVYLHHRYSLGAAAKAVGGLEFRYGVRGDPLPVTRIVPPERQKKALELLLDAIQPSELAVPERILAVLAPRPFGITEPEPRAFESRAAPAFDQLGLARMLAQSVVHDLLTPERVARVAAFADRDPALPTTTDLVDRLVMRTWGEPTPPKNGALKRVSERAVLDELLALAANGDATVQSRAAAEWGLRRIGALLKESPPSTRESAAHRALATADIDRFLNRRDAATPRSRPVATPPGSPIGQPIKPYDR
ncbi:MAG: zinc-dependent metalloprotease [Gemmatimonadaceae bacterium]